MIVVRAEIPGDIPAIRRINESAFERPNEAMLVDTLRKAAGTYLSLVAEQDGRLSGTFSSPRSASNPMRGRGTPSASPPWRSFRNTSDRASDRNSFVQG